MMLRKLFVAENVTFIALFLLYLTLGFSGYGNDNDTFGLIHSGTKLILEGDYVPSRPPGYFIPELLIGFGSLVGGLIACNALSATLATLSLLLYRGILLRHFSAIDARRLTLMTALNPFFVIAASSSIDYIYSIFFILAAVSCYLHKRSYWGGILFALAVGSRLSNCLIVAILCLYFLYESYSNKNQSELHERFFSMILAAILSLTFYIPPYIAFDNSTAFLTYAIADFSWTDLLSRLIYKNLYLFGILPILVFALSFVIGFNKSYISRASSPLIVFCLAIILVQEALFFKVPLEISYLLPILFIIFPLWLVVAKPGPALQTLMLATTVVYGFLFDIRILQVTYNSRQVQAIDAEVRPHIAKGVIVNDILTRDKAAKRWAPIGDKRFFDR